jgi:signal transduction histidine kinase/ActR/RegA family two-component response regulator
MNSTPTPDSPVVPPLESVLCTEELNRRPSRPPDYERENRALVALAQALADSPRTILQTLADTILKLFQCGSAGVSLLTEDGKRFYWPAIAGVWNPQLGGGTPRDFGPCGDVLDRNSPLLFSHFERRYRYLQPVMPPAEECLLVPFYVDGKAVGTIWAITHDDRPGSRRFDSEDLRMLGSLGTFASAAYQAVARVDALRKQCHDRDESQQAMREMNEALLVSSVRQHELTEEAQRLERKTREQAATLADLDRRKDEFLAMLGHELRNPLAPILNAGHLLRVLSDRNRLEGIENPLLQQSAGIVERQGGQLAHLVDQLLEVSRINTGRIHLDQERIAVGVVVENAVETVRALIDQHGHALTVSLSPEAIWIDADARRLEQVVVNLLANAAKYTEHGGQIWLTVQQEGEEAVLRVRDTGVGIAPEMLPRIFDLFTQAEQSLDRSQGGLGIGLALVQRLVQMHGGTVAASSALGQGSEFVARLPVVPPLQPRGSSPPTEVAQPKGRSLRVLVVDDNVDAVTTLAMLVRESGHEVRTAYDGSEVLEAALDYRPHVVLLDIGLPGLNGFEVASRLRQQPALQKAVLVAMTGYGRESDRQRAREAGFDHHLVKPGDFAIVLQILATVSELS